MGHELWHVLVLASTLLGAAALVVGVAAPLLGGGRPALDRGRLVLGGLVGMAAVLLGAEWLWVH